MSRLFLQADCTRLPLADRSVDLVLGSPPYCDARTYGIGAQRDCLEWVEWMLDVTTEAQRVSKGPVVWVAAGVTRQRNYWPACEGLMWEWWRRGGECQLYRPVFWHRVGIPGSGQSDWFRADVEYCMCFKRPGELPWSDNTAMGHPPKWAPGGEMSNRLSDGARVNQWGHGGDGPTAAARKADGTRETRDRWGSTGHATGMQGRKANGKHKTRRQVVSNPAKARQSIENTYYTEPVLANPGNLLRAIVGGGVMGHDCAHENEAPYPEKVPEFFIRSLCPPFACSSCGFPIELIHANTILQGVQEGVSDMGFQAWAEQVLQQGMPVSVDADTSRQMRNLREANRSHEIQPTESVLFPEMLEQVGGQPAATEDGHGEGVRSALEADAPNGSAERLCDGASRRDGQQVGEELEAQRSRASQKREQARQSKRQSRAYDEAAARQAVEAAQSDHLSQMRSRHCPQSICPSCGISWLSPNAIRRGIVLDPFSGSGTTVDVAVQTGRIGIGSDIRFSQCELGRRRTAEVQRELIA